MASKMLDELTLDAKSLYPGAGGDTAGTRPNTSAEEAMQPSVEGAVQTTGNPLVFWGILVGLLIGLMFLGQKVGGVEPFSNIKMTFYNVVIITLCAIIGLSALKALALKFKLFGFNQIILGA